MDEHHSRRCSQDPRSSSITPIGPLSPGPLSPTSPGPIIPQHFFSREESREIPETPGFKLLKDLSEHIEKRTGIAPSFDFDFKEHPEPPKKLEAPPPLSPTPSTIVSDEYGYIINLKDTDGKIDKTNLSKLPKKCFKTVKTPILQEDEIDDNDPYPLSTDLEEEKTFLLSKVTKSLENDSNFSILCMYLTFFKLVCLIFAAMMS